MMGNILDEEERKRMGIFGGEGGVILFWVRHGEKGRTLMRG
jgi:hypothetical protein